MRKVLIACGIVILILIAGAAILLATVDVNQFRGTIQADLQKQLHRPVTLGNMKLGLFPLAVRVSDVQVGENPRFQTGRPFAAVKEIRVRVELFPLLHKEVRVNSLDVQQPSIELVRDASGQWNYSDLTSPASANSSGNTAAKGTSGGNLVLSNLRIVDGSVAVSDLGQPSSRAVYDHIDVTLSDFAPGKTFHVHAAAQLPGAKSDSVVLEGSGENSSAAQAPFNGHLTLSDVPLAALGRFLGKSLPVDGVLSGGADIRSANSTADVKGKLNLAQATAHGAALGIPISLDYDISDDLRSGVIRAQNATLTGGGVAIHSTGDFNSKQNTINASAQTTNANLTQLVALARAFGAGDLSGSGALSFDVTAAGPLNGALNYGGSASIPNAQIATGSSGGPLKIQNASVKFNGTNAAISAGSLSGQGLTLTNVRSNCAFNHGVATLSPVAAQVFGGSVGGTIIFDSNPKPPSLAVNLKLDNVDANQLLSATTAVKNTVYGSLAASPNLHMRLGPGDALTRSLNGSLSLNLTKGHIAGVNVLNELSSIGKFVGYSLNPQNMTQIEKLSGDLAIVNGVANTKNLQLQMDGGSLAVAGSMNLVDQTLNLKTTAVMDRATSQKAGGKGIGGFMQTALANGNGELVIPAVVTGTFAHPHFEPDLAQMAQMKMKNLLPSASSPGKALQNILGGSQQQGQQGNQSPGNAIGNALNSIFKKKQ